MFNFFYKKIKDHITKDKNILIYEGPDQINKYNKISETVLENFVKIKVEHSYTGWDKFRVMEMIENVESIKKSGHYRYPIVFHGGCLGCEVSKDMGIYECSNCFYYQWMVVDSIPSKDIYPDKSKLKVPLQYKLDNAEYFV